MPVPALVAARPSRSTSLIHRLTVNAVVLLVAALCLVAAPGHQQEARSSQGPATPVVSPRIVKTATTARRIQTVLSIARASERLRLLQAAVLERAIKESKSGVSGLPPMVLSVLALAVSRLLAMDQVLGVSAGHAETLRCIEALLDHIEEGGPLLADFA